MELQANKTSAAAQASNTASLQKQSRCPFFSLERIKTSGEGGGGGGGVD